MNNNYFKTFTNCIVVEGVNRSIVLDVQRQSFSTLPNSMVEIIELFNSKKSLEEVLNLYDIDDRNVINEYLEFLIDNEFGFYTDFDEFDRFIEINKVYEYPYKISNCIVEVSDFTISIIDKIANEIESLNCRFLQFICYDILELENLKIILNALKNNNLRSIELILKYSEELFNFIPEIDNHNFRVTEITFHDSDNKNKKVKSKTFAVLFLDYELKNFSHCGVVNKKYFDVNKDKVLESLNHNSCLHKKMSIDKEGNIKNCPSMTENFGNIENTSLDEAISHPDFKKYWNITKDQIVVCKDCEFRHVCTDCRAYIEEPENKFSKPLKCGYNPYTNVWEEWSTNPLKQKAIEYYGIQDLVKKDA